jgi:superfamily I DNA/RNA helicase
LVRNVFTAPDDMILVTTFTKNLARDLDYLLGMLCTKKEKERIQVTHLSSWAAKFLRSQDVEFHYVDSHEQKTLWDKVLGAENLELPAWFYRDEWEQVMQAHDVLDKEAYWRAKRTGRGVSLTRAKRTHVWQVVSRYREELNRRNGFEDADIIREARLFLEQEENKNSLPYRAVIADEVQDLRAADLRLLRAMVPPGPNDLFVVGDAHQRIYGHTASLGPCGIDTRGRSRRLRVNYRTTKEVRDWAVARLEGVAVDDLNDGTDTLRGYRSLRRGAAPVVRHFQTEAQESEFVVQQVRDWLEKGSDRADKGGDISRAVSARGARRSRRLAGVGSGRRANAGPCCAWIPSLPRRRAAARATLRRARGSARA